MVAPILAWQDRLVIDLGMESRILPATILVLTLVVVAPILIVVVASVASAALGGFSAAEGRGLWRRFAFALVPIGAAMWLVHFGFHLATSAGTGISVIQRIAVDLGVSLLGSPAWLWGCCVTPPGWLLPLEILVLDVGLAGSIVIAWRIAGQSRKGVRALVTSLPWIAVAAALFAFGLWIVLEPMEMRGTLL
jgi:hypothetical protein